MNFNSIEEIIEDIRLAKMVIIIDDEQRENEGDLLISSIHAKSEDINFMITHARGLVCLTLTEQRCALLNLSPMAHHNASKFGTAFTQSIEAAQGVTTGISVTDRLTTIKSAIASDAVAHDIVQPGHIFPIMARNGGVLYRAGHTEAGCDLTRLAGLEPTAVICEISNEDGSMARRDDLLKFAEKHGLKIGTIADLIQFRINHETTIKEISKELVMTDFAELTLYNFEDTLTQKKHIALVKGDPKHGIAKVRVHNSYSLSDMLGIKNPKIKKNRWSFYSALKVIAEAETGVFIVIGDELENDRLFSNSSNEDQASEDMNKPFRNIGIGSQILRHLGVKEMQVLSSHANFPSLNGFNLNITKYISPEP